MEYLVSVLVFFNRVLVPFLIVVAFIFFLINVLRFFILGGANEKGRENAKRLAIYGIIALVLIFSFWGIVALLVGTFDLGGGNPLCPDVFQGKQGWCS